MSAGNAKRTKKASTAEWQPRSLEDRLLQGYLKCCGGTLHLEVPIGGPGGPGKWPPDCTTRRIDAVRVGFGPGKAVRFGRATSSAFVAGLADAHVELIEVKGSLNRTAIGQAVAARHMFTRQYGKAPDRVLILCLDSDSALEWVCAQKSVDVEVLRAVASPAGGVGYELGAAPQSVVRGAASQVHAGDEMAIEELDDLDAAQQSLTDTLMGRRPAAQRRRIRRT